MKISCKYNQNFEEKLGHSNNNNNNNNWNLSKCATKLLKTLRETNQTLRNTVHVQVFGLSFFLIFCFKSFQPPEPPSVRHWTRLLSSLTYRKSWGCVWYRLRVRVDVHLHWKDGWDRWCNEFRCQRIHWIMVATPRHHFLRDSCTYGGKLYKNVAINYIPWVTKYYHTSVTIEKWWHNCWHTSQMHHKTWPATLHSQVVHIPSTSSS